MPRTKREIPWLDTLDGVYYVFWYDAEEKRTKRISIRTKDSSQARDRYRGFLAEGSIIDGAPSSETAHVITCGEALDHYWTEHVTKNVIDRDRVELAIRHLMMFFGHMPVSELNIPLSRKYCELRAAGAIGQKSTAGTHRRELGALIAAIGHETRWKRIALSDVPYIEQPPRPQSRDRWMTRDELATLLHESGRDRIHGADGRFVLSDPDRLSRCYRFCMLSYWTASRRTAIETLTWFQVDMDAGLIYLNPAGRQQTAKKRPVVPIVRDLMPMMIRAKKEATGEYVLDHPGAIRSTFDSAVTRAGLKDVSPHVLRHTRAVHMAQDGVSLYAIAGLLGDRVATVEGNYLHHCPEHLRREIEAPSPHPHGLAPPTDA